MAIRSDIHALSFLMWLVALSILLGCTQAQSVAGASYFLGGGVPGGTYRLTDDYPAATFFDKFNFYNSYDPTNGHVQYVDKVTALNNGYATTGGGSVNISVDTTNKWPRGGKGRPSVRLTSANTYTHGLFILDIAHMPWGCGTWPAFWLLGPDWPGNGEIDIIEGVHTQNANSMSLHTSAGCTIAGSGASGTLQTTNCDQAANMNSGCGFQANNTVTANNYGQSLNRNDGGVYITEWTSQYFQIWFFPRNSIPSSIVAGTPNITQFGQPAALFRGCDIDAHFKNHSIIINTDFCGDWAGNVYSQFPECPMTPGLSSWDSCVEYVGNNPSAFLDAYWRINSIKVYQLDLYAPPPAASSTSTLPPSSARSTIPNTIPQGMGGTTSTFPASVTYTGPLSTPPVSTAATTTASTSPTICPTYNQTRYTSSMEVDYNIECGFDVESPAIAVRQLSSFDACISFCDSLAACVAVSYLGGNGPGTCYAKSSKGDSAYDGRTNSAVKRSPTDLPSHSSFAGGTMGSTSNSSITATANSTGSTMALSGTSPQSSNPLTMSSSLTSTVSPSFSSSQITSSLDNTFPSTGTDSYPTFSISQLSSTLPSPSPSPSFLPGADGSCPKSDNTIMMSEHEISYRISCYIDTDSDYFASEEVEGGFVACFNICDVTPGCTAFLFIGDSSGVCRFYDQLGQTFDDDESSETHVIGFKVADTASSYAMLTSSAMGSSVNPSGATTRTTFDPSFSTTDGYQTNSPSASPTPNMEACPEQSSDICTASIRIIRCSSDVGSTYEVVCGYAYVGDLIDTSEVNLARSALRARATVATFQDCLNLCDQNPSCVALNSEDTDCELLSSVNSTRASSRSVGAAYVQPAPSASSRAGISPSTLSGYPNDGASVSATKSSVGNSTGSVSRGASTSQTSIGNSALQNTTSRTSMSSVKFTSQVTVTMTVTQSPAQPYSSISSTMMTGSGSLCFDCSLTPTVITSMRTSTIRNTLSYCKSIPRIGTITIFTTATITSCNTQLTCPRYGNGFFPPKDHPSSIRPSQPAQSTPHPGSGTGDNGADNDADYGDGGYGNAPLPSCPAANGKTFADSLGVLYQIYCGKGIIGPTLVDTNTTTLAHCVDACDKYNLGRFMAPSACLGVSYKPSAISQNCALKSGTETAARLGMNCAVRFSPGSGGNNGTAGNGGGGHAGNGPGSSPIESVIYGTFTQTGPGGTTLLSAYPITTRYPGGTGGGHGSGPGTGPGNGPGTGPASTDTIYGTKTVIQDGTTVLSTYSVVPSTVYGTTTLVSTYVSNGTTFQTTYGIRTFISTIYVPGPTQTVTTTSVTSTVSTTTVISTASGRTITATQPGETIVSTASGPTRTVTGQPGQPGTVTVTSGGGSLGGSGGGTVTVTAGGGGGGSGGGGGTGTVTVVTTVYATPSKSGSSFSCRTTSNNYLTRQAQVTYLRKRGSFGHEGYGMRLLGVEVMAAGTVLD